jgi:hypothetical protein
MAFRPEDYLPQRPHGIDKTTLELSKATAERFAEDARYKQELLEAIIAIKDAVTYLANREKARESAETRKNHPEGPES